MDKYQYHIFSPYRVCPLGAHVDHQHGLVTGFAIDKGVDLWFNVREDSTVKLSSKTFDGDVEFEIDKPSQVREHHWMKSLLKAIWQFCSYLFVPQWGRNKEYANDSLR